MNRHVLSEISRMKEIMGILTEQIVTDHDKSYDYKKEGGKYYSRRKGSQTWNEAKGSSLEAIKTKVFRESSSSNSSSSSSSNSSSSSSPFKTKQEGDKFRKWVNDNYPDYAKQIDLDISGSHTNRYIMKAWEKYGNEYKKGKTSTDSKTSGEESNPNLVVSSDIADKFSTIDFNELSTKDSTHNVCVAGSENCAQFVNDLRDDLAYVGNAWNAYTNSRLGTTVYSAFKGLDDSTKKQVIDLWLKIHEKGGGKQNGPYKTQVKNIVNKLVPAEGKITDLQVNDTVGLFYPPSSHHEEAFYEGGERWFTEDSEGNKVPGNTINSGDGWGMNTHIGTVAAIKDGVPLIFHNVTGDVISDPPSKLRIAWIKRPSTTQGIINKVESLGKDVYDWFTS